MQVGIGLPAGIPGADGQLVIEWARRAEDGPFTSLGVVDRIIYNSYDPMLALTAAAAVTRRVKLATMIVVGLMHSTAVLAKQAASGQNSSMSVSLSPQTIFDQKNPAAASGARRPQPCRLSIATLRRRRAGPFGGHQTSFCQNP